MHDIFEVTIRQADDFSLSPSSERKRLWSTQSQKTARTLLQVLDAK
jgi:hypothetical protein